MKIRSEQVDAMGDGGKCAECQAAQPPVVAAPASGAPARSAGQPVVVASRDKPAWLAIELVDEAGVPMVGEPYQIELPNGKKIAGTLDARGAVRIEGIDPATCKVSFPERHAAGWRAAQGAETSSAGAGA